jgi:hypothetical protein
MSEQPPEDLGTLQVLLVVAVLLTILAIGVVVLVYDRSPAPQRALEKLHTSTCVRKLAPERYSPGPVILFFSALPNKAKPRTSNMAKLGTTFDASSVDPTMPFEVLPPGRYLVQIVSSEMRPTKDGAGQYLWLELDVLEGEYQGRKLFDRTWSTPTPPRWRSPRGPSRRSAMPQAKCRSRIRTSCTSSR